MLSEGSLFLNSENISINDNVFIGRQAYLDAVDNIVIESGVMIGPRLLAISSNHYYDGDDLRAIPYDNRIVLKNIIIEKNAWIGANVTILPGITIGEGSVIGMGSVVTKDVPSKAVVVGSPAKIIKYRNNKIYEQLKKDNKIFNIVFINKSIEFINK